MTFFLFYLLIIIFASIITFYMLEITTSFSNFWRTHYLVFIKAIIVFCLPKIIAYKVHGSITVDNPLDTFIFELCFLIMIMTDFFEKIIFTAIPIVLLIWKVLFLSWQFAFEDIIHSSLLAIAIFILYKIVDSIFTCFLKKESIGFGDILCLSVLAFWTDTVGLLGTFWLGSLFALIKTGLKKFIFIGFPVEKEIAFIPYMYLGYSAMKELIVYYDFYNFFTI